MSGGVRGRKFPNQRNFLLLDSWREKHEGGSLRNAVMQMVIREGVLKALFQI